MSLALERLFHPGVELPADARESDLRLNVVVVFTSPVSTLAALRRAGDLAEALRARILLLAVQSVPYPLPLDDPPVRVDWNEERFREIAEQSPVETVVRLCHGRDRIETLKNALSPKSLVVIGGRNRWWPFNYEKRLARRLRRAGHEVVFAATV
jgi:hypothetical protein